MDAKELIQLNNQKREELNQANEAYYDDILVYIRLQPGISEQQTEELVMELLDHLLEAQAAGKTAEDVFGDSPKAYCDEMIRQLPKEGGKKKFGFIGFLLFQLLGFMAIGSGGALFIANFFTDATQTVYLGSSILVVIGDVLVILVAVGLMVAWLKHSVFKKTNKIRDGLISGAFGALSLAGIFFMPKWIPTFGSSIEIPGFVILITGIVIVSAAKLINKKFRVIE